MVAEGGLRRLRQNNDAGSPNFESAKLVTEPAGAACTSAQVAYTSLQGFTVSGYAGRYGERSRIAIAVGGQPFLRDTRINRYAPAGCCGRPQAWRGQGAVRDVVRKSVPAPGIEPSW